jgi:hypothetical protein
MKVQFSHGILTTSRKLVPELQKPMLGNHQRISTEKIDQ